MAARGLFFRFTCGDGAVRLEGPLKKNTKVWLHSRLQASLSVACLVCSTQRLFRRQCLCEPVSIHVTRPTETQQLYSQDHIFLFIHFHQNSYFELSNGFNLTFFGHMTANSSLMGA